MVVVSIEKELLEEETEVPVKVRWPEEPVDKVVMERSPLRSEAA